MMYIVEGNVGISELRYTAQGKPVLKFTVAHTNNWFNRETQDWVERPPTWFNFTLWEDSATRTAEWFTKGKKVQVTCKRLTLESWESKDGAKSGVKLVGNNISLVTELAKHGPSNGGPQGSTETEAVVADGFLADEIA